MNKLIDFQNAKNLYKARISFSGRIAEYLSGVLTHKILVTYLHETRNTV